MYKIPAFPEKRKGRDFCCLLLFGKRQSAGYSFLFVPEKEAKRARRSDAAAAGRGCGPGPRDAATLRRPTQAPQGLSKEWILMA